ncbi:MAG: UTP--glucose-1-phosphate uridylyltransferase [Synergistaceae bacterium]|nr:UTP--glucose-1-phosphate uridylyltransferase [Synergistaceae bacterium]
MKVFEKVRQAVFPVAGLGTRFLPATKDIPKEMLPLIDRPLIHHGVDEAVASGCSDIIFVTGSGKESIKKYFNHSENLEKHLLNQKKDDLVRIISRIPELAEFHYAFQEKPLGLGHAVLCAEKYCKDSSFALILPDDVMISNPAVLTQLDIVRSKYGGSILCLEKVNPNETSRYGIVDAEEIETGIYKINALVEKPEPKNAPSNLAIMGRYILSSSIFKHLKQIKPGKGKEYQLTDAIDSMLKTEPVYGYIYNGRRLDCGVREGWIKATIIKSLQDKKLREIVLETLKEEKII